MEKGSCSRNPTYSRRALGSVPLLNVSLDKSNRNKEVVNVEGSCSSKRRQRSTNKDFYLKMIMLNEADSDDDDDDEEFLLDKRGINYSAQKRRNSTKRKQKYRKRRTTLRARSSRGLMVQETQKRTILSWLIDSGTVEEDTKVCYMNWTDINWTGKRLYGKITREGIFCDCCETVLTISGFEAHSGVVTDNPFMNIFIDCNINLFRCQIKAWNKLVEIRRQNHPIINYRGDTNDDTCGICGDGGDLICCDGCPSTFHQDCLGIKVIPQGNWYCHLCLCKYCGLVGIRDQCVMFTCRQCEQKFHHVCIREEKAASAFDHNGFTFCGKSCSRLFEQLQNLVGIKTPLGSGITWSLIRSFDYDLITYGNGLYKRMQYNSTLATAMTVMEECFESIIDCRTGINVKRNIICNSGSNLPRLNFGGFYTAVLERDDEILSVASIRIHGTMFAEMPFIGTRNKYRCQGMCHRLLNAIESTLRASGVEKIILPSISGRLNKWINSYGFKHIEEPLKEQVRTQNLLTFPGTVQLEKVLLMNPVNNNSANTAAAAAGGGGDAEVRINNRLVVPLPFDLNEPSEEEKAAKAELHSDTSRPTHGIFLVFNIHDGTIGYQRVQ